MKLLYLLIISISGLAFATEIPDDNNQIVESVSEMIVQELKKHDAFLLQINSEQEATIDNSSELNSLNLHDILKVEIKKVNKVNSLFNAVIYYTAGISTSSLALKGKFIEYIWVPVLNKRINANGVIASHDISRMRLHSYRLNDEIILAQDQVIGKAARSAINPHTPLVKRLIAEPVVIQKKDFVTIVYDNTSLSIKVTGIALDAGAVGEAIRVKNSRSGVVLNAKVEAAGQVRVK